MTDYLKSGLVVLIILGAMIYCDTDEFTYRCKSGHKEWCVK